MAIEVFNRYESKFLLDTTAYNKIIGVIKQHTLPDSYTNGSFYTVCNLYYDTADSYLIRNSLSKPTYKEKLRARSYGTADPGQRVYLEIKKKYRGIVNKRRCSLKPCQIKALVEGHLYPAAETQTNTQVLKEIYYLTSCYSLVPRVFIAYDRQAFFGKEDSSLRITFDKNIRTRRYNLSLTEGDYGTPLLKPDTRLMEIKCAGAMPLWLTGLLAENHIYKTSFSKYGTEYVQHLNNKQEVNYA